jgi:hypothetical protein
MHFDDFIDNLYDEEIYVLAGYNDAFLGVATVHGTKVAVYDMQKAIQTLKKELPEELHRLPDSRLTQIQLECVEQLGIKAPVFVQKPVMTPVSYSTH